MSYKKETLGGSKKQNHWNNQFCRFSICYIISTMIFRFPLSFPIGIWNLCLIRFIVGFLKKRSRKMFPLSIRYTSKKPKESCSFLILVWRSRNSLQLSWSFYFPHRYFAITYFLNPSNSFKETFSIPEVIHFKSSFEWLYKR